MARGAAALGGAGRMGIEQGQGPPLEWRNHELADGFSHAVVAAGR